MDLYRKMGNELRALFKDLFDPSKEESIRKKMRGILSIAHQIGGSLSLDAETFCHDVAAYLDNPKNEKNISRMKGHALKLEQETREL